MMFKTLMHINTNGKKHILHIKDNSERYADSAIIMFEQNFVSIEVSFQKDQLPNLHPNKDQGL